MAHCTLSKPTGFEKWLTMSRKREGGWEYATWATDGRMVTLGQEEIQ